MTGCDVRGRPPPSIFVLLMRQPLERRRGTLARSSESCDLRGVVDRGRDQAAAMTERGNEVDELALEVMLARRRHAPRNLQTDIRRGHPISDRGYRIPAVET